ncbi:MAG TPA: hypothetical protein VFU71_08335 [Burkholderiaceae bacterium]|nr:hypothetical protein [Burkholderiaceae bacterium]
MAGLVARAVVAAALLITWSLPTTRLAALPGERALALAADAICWAEGSAARASLRTPASGALAGVVPDPRVVEVAALFEPLATRRWTVDLACVLFAAVATAALLARWRVAPALVIAAAILYLTSHPVTWDAYRLVLITQSPRLWWVAISQWSPALWSERLAAPVTVWLSLFGAGALLFGASMRRFGPRLRSALRGGSLLRSPSPVQPTT